MIEIHDRTASVKASFANATGFLVYLFAIG